MIADSLFSVLVRHWPFANGAGRLIDRYGRWINLGSGVREALTSDGFRMSVIADDLIGRHILLSGRFDQSIIRVLMDFAEPGDDCLDVGANIGYMSCMMLAGIPDSTVLAVEPQPKIFDLLTRNLAQFPQQRWRAVNAGLSDAEGEGFMQVNADNHGAGRLVNDGADASFSVALLPASQVIGTMPKLDLMKMDVEGFEEVIFRAGAEVLERLQPRAILFEDALGKAPPDGAIGSLLEDMGYAIYALDKRLLATGLVRLDRGAKPTSNDYLAVSRRRKLPDSAVRRYRISL